MQSGHGILEYAHAYGVGRAGYISVSRHDDDGIDGGMMGWMLGERRYLGGAGAGLNDGPRVLEWIGCLRRCRRISVDITIDQFSFPRKLIIIK